MTFLQNWAAYLPEMLSGLKLSLLIAAVSFALGFGFMSVQEVMSQVIQGIPAVVMALALGQRQ